jgi:hypothetical protein
MTGAIKFTTVSAAGHSTSWRTSPRVEKARFSNGLEDKQHNAEDRRAQTPAPAFRARLSQSETQSSAPQWYEKRLSSTFVAQLLGQLLENETGARRSAPRAYGNRTGHFTLDTDTLV